MQEVKGNIWTHHDAGEWIAITTNGYVRSDGACVMGRGVALQAKQRWPGVPYELGSSIRKQGNIPFAFLEYKIVTVPVKHTWSEPADLDLIKRSMWHLSIFAEQGAFQRLYMPRPGCGNGRLLWEDVKPIIEPILDDRFIVVEYAT